MNGFAPHGLLGLLSSQPRNTSPEVALGFSTSTIKLQNTGQSVGGNSSVKVPFF